MDRFEYYFALEGFDVEHYCFIGGFGANAGVVGGGIGSFGFLEGERALGKMCQQESAITVVVEVLMIVGI